MATAQSNENTKILEFFAQKRGADADVAFLITRTNFVYYSLRSKPQKHAPSSVVTSLIQGLWEKFGTNAVSIVRNRIFTSHQLNEMDFGMLKVCAKRVSLLSDFSSEILNQQFEAITFEEITASSTKSAGVIPHLKFSNEAEAMSYAFSLIAKSDTKKPLAESARSIGAVLLNSQNELLASSVNSAGFDRTRHAEVNLLQDYYSRTHQPVPREAKLVTTRKPCKMCAGMLWHTAEEPLSLKVIYHDFDSGPLAKQTVLNANSFERKRCCAHAADFAVELESELKIDDET